MPLVCDGKSKPLPHSNSRSIGIWMSVRGKRLFRPSAFSPATKPYRSSIQQTYEICLVLLRISIASGR
jgi:hypothetical protein